MPNQNDNFLWTDEELEEELSKLETGGDIDLTAGDQNACEAMLRKIDNLRGDFHEIETHYLEQLEELKNWRERRFGVKSRAIAYLKDALGTYLRLSDHKTLELVAGTLRSKVAGKGSINVFNEKLLKEFAEKKKVAGLFSVPKTPEPKPSKTGVADYFKKHGKYPPGTEHIPGKPSFTVSTNHQPHDMENLSSSDGEAVA